MSRRKPYTCDRSGQYERVACRCCGEAAYRVKMLPGATTRDIFGGANDGLCLECGMEKLGAFVPYSQYPVLACGWSGADERGDWSEHDDSMSASFDRAVRLWEDGC